MDKFGHANCTIRANRELLPQNTGCTLSASYTSQPPCFCQRGIILNCDLTAKQHSTDSERVEQSGEIYWWHPNEAHNGYLEIYLTWTDSPLTGLIMTTFWRVRASLFRDFEWGRYRLGFLAAVVLSNWTEAAVRAFHPSWFIFYIIPMNYPRTHLATAQSSPSIARSEEHKKLAYAEGEP